MGSFTGTAGSDTITSSTVSSGVARNPPTPPNARPNADADFVSGGLGNDLIAAVGGNDDLRGDDGNDKIDGGADRDFLNGGTDRDFLNGGAGNDILIGGTGRDDLSGGEGTDTYRFDRHWGIDNIFPSASTGRDVIEFLDNVDRTKVEFRVENDDLIIFQRANSIFISGQFEGGAVGASTPVREVQFANGPAVDISRPLKAWLNRAGTSAYDGFIGSIFDDTLDGRAGNDNITGNAGRDILVGGKGNDEISGGADNDLFRVDKGFGVDSYFENVGEGRDTIQFGAGIALSVAQGSGLLIRQGANLIALHNQFSNGQNANARFETLAVGSQGNTVDIRKVDKDWLTRVGNNTGERFEGSIFNDTIDGGGGDDTIVAVDGNDLITGGKGNDQLDGGSGNDVYRFESGFGIDTIFERAGGGREIIEFGPGITPADLDFEVNHTNLSIIRGSTSIWIPNQFYFGTGANAFVEQIRFNNGDTLSLTRPDDWLVLTGTNRAEEFGGSVFDDTIDARGGDDNVGGDAGRDSLEGGTGNDTLNGFTDNDTVSGSAGNDSLTEDGGGSGNDSLLGGTGNDTIAGGVGLDTIKGGAGGDSLNGGAETDLFVFRNGDGVDFITGFEGADQMRFVGFGPNFNTAQKLFNAAFDAGDDVIVELKQQGDILVRVTLLDFNFDRLDADNFLV